MILNVNLENMNCIEALPQFKVYFKALVAEYN